MGRPAHKGSFLQAAETYGLSLRILSLYLIRMVRVGDHLAFSFFLDSLLEIADSFAQCSTKLGKFARSEDDQYQCENDEQFLSSQSEHEVSFRCCGVEIIKSRLGMGSLPFRVQGR